MHGQDRFASAHPFMRFESFDVERAPASQGIDVGAYDVVIAANVLPLVASVFALMLLAAMYTTAVPMLWTACNRITSDENSKKYKIGAVVLIIISCFGGQLQFGKMVGTVYPATGYMGLLLIAGMIYTKYLRKSR